MEHAMRAFIAALVAVTIVAIGAYVVLQQVQKPSSVAFTTGGARIDAVD
jgi:hypothetical protein